MDDRRNVLAMLGGGMPERVPWMGDLDYWATALVGRGQKPEGFRDSNDYIDWHRDLGVGFYLQGRFPFLTIIENCRVKEWKDGVKRYREVEPPMGTLRECWQIGNGLHGGSDRATGEDPCRFAGLSVSACKQPL